MDKKNITSVMQILQNVDPLNLIAEGAPINEYDNQSLKIARKITSSPTELDLRSFIANLFIQEFELNIQEDKLNQLTRLLMDCVKKIHKI